MLRYILTAWRPVALAALLALGVAPADVWAAGHGGGGVATAAAAPHYGGGGSHYGGYNVGGYRPATTAATTTATDTANAVTLRRLLTRRCCMLVRDISGGDDLPPDFYYSPNYTTTTPYSSVSAYYDPDAAAPTPGVTAPTVAPDAASALPPLMCMSRRPPRCGSTMMLRSRPGMSGDMFPRRLRRVGNFTYDVAPDGPTTAAVTDLTRTITVHANSVTSSISPSRPRPPSA